MGSCHRKRHAAEEVVALDPFGLERHFVVDFGELASPSDAGGRPAFAEDDRAILDLDRAVFLEAVLLDHLPLAERFAVEEARPLLARRRSREAR